MHFNTPTRQNLKQGAKNLDLNKLMQNVGAESFDYGTFKAAFDTDPRVKAMVKNFDKNGLEPKTKNELEGGDEPTNTAGTGAVDRMAKRATDLSDL